MTLKGLHQLLKNIIWTFNLGFFGPMLILKVTYLKNKREILDIKIDEDLELEGLARDVVRAVQQARKDADLQISDRIKLGISCSDHLNKAIKLHKDYICSQTLCQEIEYRLLQQYDHKSNIKIDNEDLELTIKRI